MLEELVYVFSGEEKWAANRQEAPSELPGPKGRNAADESRIQVDERHGGRVDVGIGEHTEALWEQKALSGTKSSREKMMCTGGTSGDGNG